MTQEQMRELVNDVVLAVGSMATYESRGDASLRAAAYRASSDALMEILNAIANNNLERVTHEQRITD